MSSPTMESNGAKTEEHEHGLTQHVFSISASMVGICMTGISLLSVVATQKKIRTFGDELLAVDAVLFMTCCFVSFWSFKTKNNTHRRVLRWVVDSLFMIGLLVMVVVSGLIAYAIG